MIKLAKKLKNITHWFPIYYKKSKNKKGEISSLKEEEWLCVTEVWFLSRWAQKLKRSLRSHWKKCGSWRFITRLWTSCDIWLVWAVRRLKKERVTKRLLKTYHMHLLGTWFPGSTITLKHLFKCVYSFLYYRLVNSYNLG